MLSAYSSNTFIDGCVWIMKIVLSEASYFRRWNNIQKAHSENFWWKHIKNESCKCYLGNKEQKAMFLVVSRSNLHFGFDHPFFFFFFACPIGRESKIARPKIRPPAKKFVQPYLTNLQLKAAGLFKYVWPFIGYQLLKGFKLLALQRKCCFLWTGASHPSRYTTSFQRLWGV